MDITVLGCGAAYPRPGGACSGFLVSDGGTTVWLDAGNGTFSRLQQITDYRKLDALVISHGHGDHTADVLPLMYAMGFDPQAPVSRMALYAPSDVPRTLAEPLGRGSRELFDTVFEVHPASRPFAVGPLSFAPFRTVHTAETYGFRIESNGAVLAYTSDTAWDEALVEPCRRAGLLVAEATYVDGVDAPVGMHMWAREAGRLAAEAGAERLVLTHVWPTLDLEAAVSEAASVYDGPVEAAADGVRYTIT